MSRRTTKKRRSTLRQWNSRNAFQSRSMSGYHVFDRLASESLENRLMMNAGTLDTSFSDDGRLAIDVNPIEWSTAYESAMDVQADGKLVVATNYDQGNIAGALVMRINVDGSLDESFSNAAADAYWDGGSGRAWFGSTPYAIYNPHDVLVQPDGKILVLGDGGLIRLDADGRLDPTFGVGGVVDTQTGADGLLPSTGTSHFYALAWQDDGHIVLAGHAGTTSTNSDFYLVRLSPTGTLDTSFGSAGKVQINIGGGTGTTDTAYDLAIEDGKIVVVGNTKSSAPGSLYTSAAIRLLSTGALDPSFTGDGIWSVDVNPGSLRQETIYSVTLPGDGSILMSGHGTMGSLSVSNFLLIRLDNLGAFESTFTGDGFEFYSLGLPSSLSYSVTTDASHRIIASGWGSEGGATDRFVVARFSASGALDPSFDGDGVYVFWPGIDAGGTNNTSVRDVVIRPTDQSIAVCGQTYVYTAFDGLTVNPYSTFDATIAVFSPADGSLDTSFDDDGVTSFAGNVYSYDEGFSVIGQSDGKLLISGLTGQFSAAYDDFVVARVNPDGSLDATFDADGIKTIWFGAGTYAGEDKANALAVQSDGKILAAGVVEGNTVNRKFGVVRLNPDGSLDTTFAGTGQLTLDPTTRHDELNAIAVQPDGKILLGGYITSISGSTTSVDFAVMRLNPDGTTDTSFGVGGLWSQHMGTASNSHKVRSLLVQPDGKIVVSSGFGPTLGGGAVARLNPDGTLDTSFDGDGMRTFTTLPGGGTSTITIDHLESSTLQPDGKIILVGSGRINTGSTGNDFIAIRLNADGSLDTSFDADGYRLVPAAPGAVADRAYGVAVQQNGRIVISGQSNIVTNSPDFSVVRLNSDGSTDTTFATAGAGTYDLSGTAYGYPDANSDDFSRSMYLEPGGNIVVAGFGVKVSGINQLPGDMEMIRVIGDRLPVDILLSNSTINENSPPNSLVGDLSTIDPDATDTHSYSLVSGAGDDHNLEFAIVGNQLVAVAPYDYETTSPRTIRIRTTDQTGSYYEESFTITVLDANEAPSAYGESFYTLEDTVVGQTAAGVLVNDTDPEFQTLTAQLVSGAANGIVVLNTDGSWTYTPTANWNGPDSFTYQSVDPFGLTSDPVTVTIEVAPVDDAPTTASQSVSTDEDTELTIWLTGDDGDPELTQTLTFSLGTGPTHGSITYFDAATGEVHYMPGANYNGSDAFTYSVADGSGMTAEATIAIDVLPINDPPTADAGADQAATAGDSVAVLGQYTDVDAGDTHLFTWHVTASNGQIIADGNNTSFNFVPEAAGTYTAVFTVVDSAGATASDELIVTVSPNITVQPVAVSGRVYNDGNNDGLFQPGLGESGIGGLELTLAGADMNGAAVLRTTLSGADGSYEFADVLPGTYTLSSARPAGWLDGQESAGTLGGVVDNAIEQSTITGITIGDGGVNATDYLFGNLRPAEISGLVWEDFNADGEVNFGERAIEGATISLSGVDDRGNTVSQTGFSDADGIFMFYELRPGAYILSEAQPAGYNDGLESLGTINGMVAGTITANDQFGGLDLAAGAVGINYNFAERAGTTGQVSHGQTATIGFWQNKNGRALVLSLNGSANSTQLSMWLATTFPNIYGSQAGPNNLSGLTNTQVWEKYNAIFRRKQQEATALGLGGALKVDAQIFATALAVYVTNANLAGSAGTSFGFVVTQSGVGAATISVGSAGQAFGVANGTQQSVLDLLLAIDSQTHNGVLFDLDSDGDANNSMETQYRNWANTVFTAINEQGDI